MNKLETLATALTVAALSGCTPTGKPTQYWPDQDRDGYGVTSDYQGAKVYPEVTCTPGEFPAINSSDPSVAEAVCATQEELKGKMYLKTLAPRAGDCNDSDAAINPDAAEVLDDKDNNCDQRVDTAPLPEGLGLPYEKISMDGKAMFATDPTPWETVLKELSQNATSWADPRLKTDGAYGLKPGTSLLKDPAQQEQLYNWALPYMSYRVGKADPEVRAGLKEELDAAAAYAATLDVSKETKYLHTLQATDCTDVYRKSGYVDLGEKEHASCQQFFVHYGPDAPWKEAIAQARARGNSGDYEYDPFIFINEPTETPHRDLQARLYRHVASGEVTKEALQGWITRAERDLAPALGVVEQ